MTDPARLGGVPERHEQPIRRAASVARLVVAIGLAGCGLALLGLSSVSYDWVAVHVDQLAVDADAAVDRERFDSFVLRLRLLGASLLVLVVVMHVVRSTVDRVLASVLDSWRRTLTRAPGAMRSWVTESPVEAMGLAIVTLIATVLRISFLDVPLRYDEATTYVSYVVDPFYAALSDYSEPNNHLLHTLAAKITTGALGTSETALRLPALLAGVALVPATFALGRVLYGASAALLAAMAVAVSSTLVEYSTNARGYTLVALCTVLALHAATRAVAASSTGALAAVAVLCALGLYAVPVMAYPAAGIMLWILVSRLLTGEAWRRVFVEIGGCAAATSVVTALLYVPVLAVSGFGALFANDYVAPMNMSAFVSQLDDHVLDVGSAWSRDLANGAGWAVGLLVVAGLVAHRRVSHYLVPPLAALVGVAVVLVLLQRVVPFARVWTSLLPVAGVTAAALPGWALDRLPRKQAAAAAAMAAVTLAAIGAAAVHSADAVRTSRETGALLDAPVVAHDLARVVRPGDRILATGSDTILEYYLGRLGVNAGPMLYTDTPRRRTYVVVNRLGGQTLDGVLADLPPTALPTVPTLLEQYPSAFLYRLGPPPPRD